MDSILFNNINMAFDVIANYMALRHQFPMQNQPPNMTPCDSNAEQIHMAFCPETLEMVVE